MKKTIEHVLDIKVDDVFIYCRYDEDGNPQCKINVYIYGGAKNIADFHIEMKEAKSLLVALENLMGEYRDAFPDN